MKLLRLFAEIREFIKRGRESSRANISFEDWEAEQMLDPEFRAAAEELEPAHQEARQAIKRSLGDNT